MTKPRVPRHVIHPPGLVGSFCPHRVVLEGVELLGALRGSTVTSPALQLEGEPASSSLVFSVAPYGSVTVTNHTAAGATASTSVSFALGSFSSWIVSTAGAYIGQAYENGDVCAASGSPRSRTPPWAKSHPACRKCRATTWCVPMALDSRW